MAASHCSHDKDLLATLRSYRPRVDLFRPTTGILGRNGLVVLAGGLTCSRWRYNKDLSAARPDWFLALSPTGKAPLLKLSQPGRPGAVLFESMVICDYLEETLDGAGLYPVDALSRAQHRGWIEFGTATGSVARGKTLLRRHRLRHGRCGVRASFPVF